MKSVNYSVVSGDRLFDAVSGNMTGQSQKIQIPGEGVVTGIRELSYVPECTAGHTKADLGFVKRYVRLHLEEDLSLERLAHLACLSPNYLSYLFKKKEGEPLKKYIERNRIERAAYLLITEESTAAEIAGKVGYRYCSYFCNVFKSYYGLSPMKYRRAVRTHLSAGRPVRTRRPAKRAGGSRKNLRCRV